MESIPEGATVKVQFREKDADGNYLSLAGYSDIIALTSVKAGVIVKHSKSVKDGYGRVVLDNDTTAHYILTHEDTKLLHSGILTIEIMGKGPVTSEYPIGTRLIYASSNDIIIKPTLISQEP